MKSKVSPILKQFKSITNSYMTQIGVMNKSIRDTFEEEINLIKEDLITRIAVEYSLDANELKNKFLKKKKKSNDLNETNDDNNSDSEYMPSISNEKNVILLKKIEYDNNFYYVEMKEGGKIFDINKNEVGIWSNGIVELNMNIISQLKNLDIQINGAPSLALALAGNINNIKQNQLQHNNDDDFCKVVKKTPILTSTKTDIIPDQLIIETKNVENNDVQPKKRVGRRKTKQFNQ